MILRPYQREALDATWNALRARKDNPCVVLPTGSGKTPLLAELCREAVINWDGRILIVSHVKELLQQAKGTLEKWWNKHPPIGVYSAGLNSKNVSQQIVIAGIQSAYKSALDFGERHLVIVDEAHTIPNHDDGMYRQFLGELKQANPCMRVIGLTATPYRTDSGSICTPDGILQHICYKAEIADLIQAGFLSPVVNSAVKSSPDVSEVKIKRGEFDPTQMATCFDMVVQESVEELLELSKDRKSILVFAASVNHGDHVCEELCRRGMDAEFLHGQTLDIERAGMIERFKAGRLRCLVNVNVLTTGFDATSVDCVAVLRATCSPGLFYQMCGRGFRLHPGKENCLVLDYGGNIERHGPLDSPRYGQKSVKEGTGDGKAPTKVCVNCLSPAPIGALVCEKCGLKFLTDDAPRHEGQADQDARILSRPAPPPEWRSVTSIYMSEHRSRKNPDGVPTLRVDYMCDNDMLPISEWVCIEHEGFARQKAITWWNLRSQALFPGSVEEAIDAWGHGMLADTRRILVGQDPKNPRFDRIVKYDLGPIPTADEWRMDDADLEEIPF